MNSKLTYREAQKLLLEDIKLMQAPSVTMHATIREVGKLFVDNHREKI